MGQGNPGLVQNMNSDMKAYNENSVKFIHLFIYKLCQEVWITHRASSTTRTKKKKESLSYNRQEWQYFRNDKKKTEMQKQN